MPIKKNGQTFSIKKMTEENANKFKVREKLAFSGKERVLKEEKRLTSIATLENCVGRQAGNALATLSPFIRALEHNARCQAKQLTRRGKTCSDKCLPESDGEGKIRPGAEAKWQREQNRQKHLQELMANAYLGRAGKQRNWFKHLQTRPLCGHNNNNCELMDLAKEGEEELTKLLATLRENKPLYHFKYKYRKCDKIRKKQNLVALKKKREIVQREIDRMFNNLEHYRNQHFTKKCCVEAHSIKSLLERLPSQMHDVREKFGELLATIMGEIYLSRKFFLPYLTHAENCLRTACLLCLDAKYYSMKIDDIIQSSDFPFHSNSTWRNRYKEFLSVTDNDTEKAWIHHEIARTYAIERKWEHLVAQGNKAAACAKRCGNSEWVINSLYLVAMGASQRRDSDEVLEAIQESMEVATKMQNSRAQECLAAAKEAISRYDAEIPKMDHNIIISKRKDTILGLMKRDTTLQGNTRDLFSRMQALPPDRRFSIMAGVKPTSTQTVATSQEKSILPGGPGGRLGIHPVTTRDFWDFVQVQNPLKK